MNVSALIASHWRRTRSRCAAAALEWVITGTAGAHPFVVNGVSIGCIDGCGRIAHNRDYRVAVASIVADPARTPAVTTAPL